MADKFDRYLDEMEGRPRKKFVGENVVVAGAGYVEGGVYGKVSVSGSLKVRGDLEADEFKVAGAASVDGSVRAGVVRASGALTVHGDLVGDVVRAAGSLSVSGVLKGGDVKVAGSLKAEEVDGSTIKISGSFRVRGAVRGEYVELILDGDSSAERVEGGEVHVRAGEKKIAFLRFVHRLRGEARPVLKASLVKAGVIHLRGVVVEGLVEADRVYVEEGADVRGVVRGKVIRR